MIEMRLSPPKKVGQIMIMRIGMRLPPVGPGLITKDALPPCSFPTKSGDTQSLLVFRTPGILFHQIKRVFFFS